MTCYTLGRSLARKWLRHTRFTPTPCWPLTRCASQVNRPCCAILALMSMSSTGLTGAEYEAVRTVAAAIVQARFLQRIEAAANSLTASSSRLERLTLLLIVLTGVLVVMTMALIVEPLIK